MSIKDIKENVASHENNENESNCEVASLTAAFTPIRVSFDVERVQVT